MCKGIYYQYRDKSFINEKGEIIQKNYLSFRKKISCKGCSRCKDLKETLREAICNDFKLSSYKLEPYSIYQLKIYGCEDDFDFIFIKSDENGNII